MCGIAGLLYADRNRRVAPELLRAMGRSIAHRGPDAEGLWIEPGVGLVHRRLSILDLEGGNQPLGNEDGSVQVVFNGEIYNFQELRADLQARGHVFRTRSDTEVIAHLYEEHEDRLVERLRGMFAFALWDRRHKRLLLARDRLGIKPLYLYRDADKLVFGSELKAILACPGVPRHLDVQALETYFAYGVVAGTPSIFRGIDKLPPAHVLVAEAERLAAAPRRYWQLRIEPDDGKTAEQWQQEIRAKVAEAARLHLIADVPVGAFLSGGVDSSIVVGCAASAGAPGALKTFSMGMLPERYSELPYARETARFFATDHTEQVVTPDAAALLDQLSYYFDEPFADSSAIPTFLVSRLARARVKVALSGDGGDEAFGGYSRYAHDLGEAKLRSALPAWFRRLALGPAARLWPKADWLPRFLRAKTTLTNLSLDPASAYANTLSICRRALRRELLSGDVTQQLNGYEPESLVRGHHAAAQSTDALAGMIAADVGMLLPDDFLVKVDRASMAHGLEVRPPLLDHEVFELAARVPSRWKIHHGQTKWILKQAFADRLPPGTLTRAKCGFEVPVDDWLRGPLATMFEDAVLVPQSPIADLVNRNSVRKLYREHRQGIGRHGQSLWTILVFARWADRYLRNPSLGDGPGPGPESPLVQRCPQ